MKVMPYQDQLSQASIWSIDSIRSVFRVAIIIFIISGVMLQNSRQCVPELDVRFVNDEVVTEALDEWQSALTDDASCQPSLTNYALSTLLWDTMFPLSMAIVAFLVIALASRSLKSEQKPSKLRRGLFTLLSLLLTGAVLSDLLENLSSIVVFHQAADPGIWKSAYVLFNNAKWLFWLVPGILFLIAVSRLLLFIIPVLFHIRFPVLAVLLGGMLSLAVPQVIELYILMEAQGDAWWGLLVGTALATTVWYCSRITLRFQLPTWWSPGSELSQPVKDVINYFKIWLPRVLGTLVLVIMAIAYPGNSLAFWLAALIFAVFVIWRRPVFGKFIEIKRFDEKLGNDYLEQAPWDLSDISTTAKCLFVIAIVLNAIMILWAAHDPSFLKPIGSVAIVLLAGLFFVIAGSIVCLIGTWTRIPIVSILIILAVVLQIRGLNDNHYVRHCPESTAQSPSAALCKEDIPASRTGLAAVQSEIDAIKQSSGPVFLISAEGGGIRAAAWTSIVLGHLEDRADLAAHTFAGSGVSGGSLGLATYAASLALKTGNGVDHSFQQLATEMTRDDFLAPTLTAMFFNDSLQRIVPLKLPDRGMALEQAWENRWREVSGGKNHFREPLTWLYRENSGNIPYLLLNTTTVQDGQRVIQHPWDALPSESHFPGAIDGNGFVPATIPLSAVVHNSARFTYISPAGTVLDTEKSPTAQWVDGGYFEASAAETMVNVLEWLVSVGIDRNQIHVIHISNSLEKNSDSDTLQPAGEVFAPISSILNSRVARGHEAFKSLQASAAEGQFHHFRIHADAHELPLGWTLSERSFEAIRRQLDNNRSVITGILEVLPARSN